TRIPACSTSFPYTTLFRSMMEEARRQSDIAWEKAKVIIEQEAKQGKPYIPWAGRPTDLPQAEIPAFPGAEGGGAYSFGGRGGKRSEEHTSELQSREKLVCR